MRADSELSGPIGFQFDYLVGKERKEKLANPLSPIKNCILMVVEAANIAWRQNA